MHWRACKRRLVARGKMSVQTHRCAECANAASCAGKGGGGGRASVSPCTVSTGECASSHRAAGECANASTSLCTSVCGSVQVHLLSQTRWGVCKTPLPKSGSPPSRCTHSQPRASASPCTRACARAGREGGALHNHGHSLHARVTARSPQGTRAPRGGPAAVPLSCSRQGEVSSHACARAPPPRPAARTHRCGPIARPSCKTPPGAAMGTRGAIPPPCHTPTCVTPPCHTTASRAEVPRRGPTTASHSMDPLWGPIWGSHPMGPFWGPTRSHYDSQPHIPPHGPIMGSHHGFQPQHPTPWTHYGVPPWLPPQHPTPQTHYGVPP